MSGGLAYLNVIIFYIAQCAASIFAFREGGRAEKVVAVLLPIAGVLSVANGIVRAPSFENVDVGRLAIDTALLAALTAIALVANRFWPIWLVSLHLLTIAVHGARAYDSDLIPYVYAIAIGKIAYSMLVLLVVGAFRHQSRLRQHGVDRDWSWEIAR